MRFFQTPNAVSPFSNIYFLVIDFLKTRLLMVAYLARRRTIFFGFDFSLTVLFRFRNQHINEKEDFNQFFSFELLFRV